MKNIINLLILFNIIFLLSCGSNIFENFNKDNEEDLSELVDNASTVEDYNNIIDQANEVIDSTASNDNEKIEAYESLSTAILGANELSPLDLFVDIADAAEDSENIFNIVNIVADVDALIEASDALSEVDNLGGELDESQHLLQGVTNTMIVMSVIDSVFEIDSSGDATLKDSETTFKEALKVIIYPDDNESKTIADYFAEANDSYNSSNSLTNSQLNDLDDAEKATEDLVELYEKIDEFNDDELEAEIDLIFEGVNQWKNYLQFFYSYFL